MNSVDLTDFSPRFQELLKDATIPWHAMSMEISESPTLAWEAEQFYVAMNASKAAGALENLIVELGSHKDDFPSVDLPGEVWDGLWRSYAEALKDYSVEALSWAFKAWSNGEMYPKDIGRHQVYPTASELICLCKRYVLSLKRLEYRANIAFQASRSVAETIPPEHYTQAELTARAELGEAF